MYLASVNSNTKFKIFVTLGWNEFTLFCDGLQGEVLVDIKYVDTAGGFLNGDEWCEGNRNGENKPSTCPQTRGDIFHSNG